MTSALVVLSGGQDSTTCLYWARARFDSVSAVTYNYGQRHARELAAAIKVAELANVPHVITTVGSILQGRSPLTDPTQPLEQYQSHDQMAEVIGDRVELTFVPMRNALFLTLAANHAICRNVYNLVTGVCEADNANYPDCRARFIESQEDTINKALGFEFDNPKDKRWVSIHTPLMHMAKPDSVHLALSLPGCYRALAYSHTAYDGQYPPVGHDHATVLRAHGFEKAGVPDPLVLRAIREGLMPWPITDNYSASACNKVVDLLTADEMPKNWVA